MSTVLKGKKLLKRNCATAIKVDIFSHVQLLCFIKGQDLCWWHLTKTPPQHYKSLMIESVLTHWMIITTVKLIQTTTSEVLIVFVLSTAVCEPPCPPFVFHGTTWGPHHQVSLRENVFVTRRVCTEPEGKSLKHKAEIRAEGWKEEQIQSKNSWTFSGESSEWARKEGKKRETGRRDANGENKTRK